LLNFMENGVFQELPSYNVRPDMRARVYVHEVIPFAGIAKIEMT
jgi:hypothetical protein